MKNQQDIKAESILYIIKNILTLQEFDIQDYTFIKKIFFFYFYKSGVVSYTNKYEIFFIREKFPPLTLTSIDDIYSQKVSNFESYFNLGRNDIFLNKIKDLSCPKSDDFYTRDAYEIDNFIDFFFLVLHENSELYSFSGEHFPLFKWLVNEITETIV